jgi:hypothetical protein
MRQDTRIRHDEYRKVGFQEAKACANPFMFAFWSLYWGEGSKTQNQVAMANMDSHIIKIFMEGMMQFYKVPLDKFIFRISWHTHANYSYDDILQYWCGELGLPKEQSRKGICKTTYYPSTKIQSHYGVCNLRVNSTEILYRILGAIDFMRTKEFFYVS